MVFGLKVPIVDDIVDEGEEIAKDIVDTVVDTAADIGRMFSSGAASFGQAASFG